MASYGAAQTYDQHQDPSASAGYASNATPGPAPQTSLSKFPLFKGLGTEKLRADGQPPKRRGPKPDTKPALTRRQELNRQAQRTHRERKEMYIKALEQEVMRMKDMYGEVARQRNAYAAEVRRLSELLAAHGIAVPEFHTPPLPREPSSSGSFSGSYGAAPSSSSSPPPASSPQHARMQAHTSSGYGPNSSQSMDYDQVGIDFVLALERPCMDHMQMLCVKSQANEEEISGHALMATCPTESHLIERPDVQYPHAIPSNMTPGNLLKLLDLSNRLPLDGEITPVMAWALIIRHYAFPAFSAKDIAHLAQQLLPHVRCYGFGAVLEEFEVVDAIDALMSSNPAQFAAFQN